MARHPDEGAQEIAGVGLFAIAARTTAAAAATFAATAATAAPDWVYFFTAEGAGGSYVHSYDPTSIAVTNGQLFVRGKMTMPGFTSLYEVRIDCARDSYTEVSTTVTDDKGAVYKVPDSERYTDRPLKPNSSGEKLRSMFCNSV